MLVFSKFQENFKRNQKMRKENPSSEENISLMVGLTNKETLKKIFKKI